MAISYLCVLLRDALLLLRLAQSELERLLSQAVEGRGPPLVSPLLINIILKHIARPYPSLSSRASLPCLTP